jgi:NAD(P)H-hydrate epimerase
MCYGVDSLTISIELLPTKSSVMKASAVVLGPGLGQTSWSKQMFDAALAAPPIPLVVDADALNWLSRTKEIPPRDNWVLTPHPGEAARLLKIKPEEVQADRKKAALALQKQYGGVVVLKGAQTLVVAENQQIYTCLAGNPGMASAGMGDLLSGIIAGLIGEGLTPWQAAAAGVFIHATAGDRVAAKQGERGLLASDLLAEIPLILNNKLHS